MKIGRLLSIATSLLIILTLFAGCRQEATLKIAASDENVQSKNLFDLKLYSDKQIYKVDEKISIWATIEYTGDSSEIKIWHGEPYLVFSITDGKDFNLEGVVLDILKSTTLKKGTIYRHGFIKSGGYSADDPNAGFWKKFFEEKDLYLPEGEYTIKVSSAFSLTQDVLESEYHKSAEIKIKVKS